MPFQRRQNKHLNIFTPESQSQELQGEGFPRPAGSQDSHVGILVNLAVEQVGDNQRIVMFVDPKQNSIVVAELIGRKGITAGGAQSQHIPSGTGIQMLFQRYQWQRGQKSVLLPEGTGGRIQIL